MRKMFMTLVLALSIFTVACPTPPPQPPPPPPPLKLTITTTQVPVAIVGQAYDFTFAATNGTPPYRWSILDGALPNGLIMSTDGHVTGVPDFADCGIGKCDFGFTVQVMDSAGNSVKTKVEEKK